jgi:hypothetical protein
MGLLKSRFEINSLVSSAIKITAHSGPQKLHLSLLGPDAPEATDFEAQLSPLTNDVLPQEGRRGCAVVPFIVALKQANQGWGARRIAQVLRRWFLMQAFLKRAWNAGT